MTDAGAAVNSVLTGRAVDPAPALLDSGSGAGMTDVEAAVNSVLPVAQSTPARPPGFRLVGRNDGCGGRRQLGSAGRVADPAPALLDSGSWAGMTDVWDGNEAAYATIRRYYFPPVRRTHATHH